jgi:hypothetical protein
MAKFRSEAYGQLQKLIQHRKFLLINNYSMNDLTMIKVECLQEKLLRINSDHSMAKFITDHAGMIRMLPPAHHIKTNQEVNELIETAENYLIPVIS